MSNQYKAILVDDEEDSIQGLNLILSEHCPEISIIDTANSAKQAIKKINSQKPDLIFLDIQMPDGDGFNVLESLNYNNFGVVFATAFEQYAIKAFEFSALHYLLKPFDPLEVKNAVERFKKRKINSNTDQLDVLKNVINYKCNRIILPTNDGIQLIELEEIIRCEADSNYTLFHLTNNDKILVSNSLNKYEAMLEKHFFARVHNKHLVNLKHIKKYVKGLGCAVILSNGAEVEVSTRKKHNFLLKLKEYTLNQN